MDALHVSVQSLREGTDAVGRGGHHASEELDAPVGEKGAEDAGLLEVDDVGDGRSEG